MSNVIWPSWARCFSTMLSSARILIRLTRPGARSAGNSATSRRIPSTRARIRRPCACGSMCRSLALSRRACATRRLTIWTTGASFSPSRRGAAVRVGGGRTIGRVLAKALICASRSPVTRYRERIASSMSDRSESNGMTVRPTISSTSSMRARLLGSSVATRRLASSEPPKPRGRTHRRRASISPRTCIAPSSLGRSRRSTSGVSSWTASTAASSISSRNPSSRRISPRRLRRMRCAASASSSWPAVIRPALSSRSPIRGCAAVRPGRSSDRGHRRNRRPSARSTDVVRVARPGTVQVSHHEIPGQSRPTTCRPATAAVAAPTASAGAKGSGSRRPSRPSPMSRRPHARAHGERDEDGNEDAGPAGNQPDQRGELDVAPAHGTVTDRGKRDEECARREPGDGGSSTPVHRDERGRQRARSRSPGRPRRWECGGVGRRRPRLRSGTPRIPRRSGRSTPAKQTDFQARMTTQRRAATSEGLVGDVAAIGRPPRWESPRRLARHQGMTLGGARPWYERRPPPHPTGPEHLAPPPRMTRAIRARPSRSCKNPTVPGMPSSRVD